MDPQVFWDGGLLFRSTAVHRLGDDFGREEGARGRLGRQGQPEPGRLAGFGPGKVVSVDVDVGQELEEDAFGRLDHPVGHSGGDAGGPGHPSNPFDLALVQDLLGPEQLPDGAGEQDLAACEKTVNQSQI